MSALQVELAPPRQRPAPVIELLVRRTRALLLAGVPLTLLLDLGLPPRSEAVLRAER